MRASCKSRPARVALAGLAVVLSLLASGGARADDPASQADALRAQNTGLAAKSQRFCCASIRCGHDWASRSSVSRRSRREARELEREEESARNQLAIARDNMASAHSQLGERLRQLYIEGDVDPLAVLLGAESLDDALSALDGLNRLADQDRAIIDQLRSEGRPANRPGAASRRAGQRLQTALADAKSAHTSPSPHPSASRPHTSRACAGSKISTAADLRPLRPGGRERAATEDLTGAEAEAAGPPPPPPPPAGGEGDGLLDRLLPQGHDGDGIPVGWGVVAVDPSFIPLGTRMFVPGYGEGVAADTGSAVRGAMIDLWFPTCARALAWGWRRSRSHSTRLSRHPLPREVS